MMSGRDLPTFLSDEFNAAKSRNPAYSLRAFAKKTGLGVGTVSMLLAGKRKLTPKTAIRVLSRLGVPPDKQEEMIHIAYPKIRVSPTLLFEQYQLTIDQNYILSEWQYFAILSLVRCQAGIDNADDVASRLGIGRALAEESLARLQRSGLIRKDGSKWVRTHLSIKTSDGIPNDALRASHDQSLVLAREALAKLPIELRDFTWMTFPFNPSRIDELKNRIRQFQDEITAEFTCQPGLTEVYRLSTQLFPMTQVKKRRVSSSRRK